MLKFLALLLLFTSCSRLPPEESAIIFMRLRYADPVMAYRMVEKKDITQENFLRQHAEMLRVKDYKIHRLLKFKVISSKKEGSITKVVVETTRPDIVNIFKGFYQAKIAKGWSSKEIKKEMLRLLSDPKAPQEKIQTTVKVEDKKGKLRIRWI